MESLSLCITTGVVKDSVTTPDSDRLPGDSMIERTVLQPVWYFSNLVLTFQKKGLWSNQKWTSQKKLAYAFDHPTAEIAQRLRVWKDGQFEPRTKISLWSMIAIPEDWPFLKKQLVL